MTPSGPENCSAVVGGAQDCLPPVQAAICSSRAVGAVKQPNRGRHGGHPNNADPRNLSRRPLAVQLRLSVLIQGFDLEVFFLILSF